MEHLPPSRRISRTRGAIDNISRTLLTETPLPYDSPYEHQPTNNQERISRLGAFVSRMEQTVEPIVEFRNATDSELQRPEM